MSFLLDSKYALFIGGRLEKFRQVRRNVWNCRCPMCGDSAKRKNIRRFFIYQPVVNGMLQDRLSVACHNCGYAKPFGAFLHEFDGAMFGEYKMEKFRDNNAGMTRVERAAQYQPVADQLDTMAQLSELGQATPDESPMQWVRPLCDAPDGHPVLLYAQGRRFPEWVYEELGYCDNFAAEYGEFSPLVDATKLPDDPRLIIPIRDTTGELIALQGRTIGNHSLRYITLKRQENVSKVFGLDRLQEGVPVLVVEGPLDSLFLPNCIATADANLLAAPVGDILIPDKQFRNPEIVRYIERFIDEGKAVCLLTDEVFPYKDINQAVQAGVSPAQVLGIVLDHTYRGLTAKLKLSELRRVSTAKRR